MRVLDTQKCFLVTQNCSRDTQHCSLYTQNCSLDTQNCSPDTAVLCVQDPHSEPSLTTLTQILTPEWNHD